MRYLHLIIIAATVGLLGCARRSDVAVTPDTTGRVMTTFGQFSPTGSSWTVRVSDSDGKIHISRPTQFGSTGISPSKWKAELGWFAFVENEERVWAYDGHGYLYLLTLTPNGMASYGRVLFRALSQTRSMRDCPTQRREILRVLSKRWPNHALQRTRPSHHCCNRGVPRAGSLSLGRWPSVMTQN